MKVYIIEPHNEYARGCAIVAADSSEQAKNYYLSADDYNSLLYDAAKCRVRELNDMEYIGDEIVIVDTLWLE